MATNFSRIGVVFLCVAGVACGQSIQILPLTGEDPEIVALIGAEASVVEEDEPTRAAMRLYRLLKQGQVATFWDLLTPETQKSLETLAGQGGLNALEMLHTRRFTNPKDPEGDPITVDVEALFFAPKPTAFKPVGAGVGKAVEASVVVHYGAAGKRVLQLKKIDKQWRLHRTRFQSLPLVTPKVVPLLPGHYTLQSDLEPEAATSGSEKVVDRPESESTPSPANDDF